MQSGIFPLATENFYICKYVCTHAIPRGDTWGRSCMYSLYPGPSLIINLNPNLNLTPKPNA